MFEVSGLSKKDIQEEYEDLVFRKVMAIYVENESKQILAEIKAEKESNNEPVDTKVVEKLYDKKERRENLSILWKYSKKVVSFAAMIVFVAIISLSSAVVAFADVRESVAEYLYYYLTYKDNRLYTEVGVGEQSGFVDKEIYTWDRAYAPTYIPEGFVLDEVYDLDLLKIVNYVCDEKYVSFSQLTGDTIYADTEEADKIKDVKIGNSKGLLIVKKELISIYWSIGDTLLEVSGNIDEGEIIEIAKNIKIIK